MQTLINSPDIVHQALLPIDAIVPSTTNPRKRISEQMLDELAASIAKVGVLQPILVRPHPVRAERYEIVAGECRWRSTVKAGLQDIPAIIRDLTDLEALELQVLENLHRTDLHPLEEAEGFQQLLDANGYTVDTLAAKLGKSKAVVYASLKLCALCPAGREAFYDGKLTASTALLVARIPGAKLQEEALKEITKPDYAGAIPSYRDAVRIIRYKYMLDLDRAVFDTDDALLIASAGDCQSCEKRSGNCRQIYPDIDSADVCTDPECFKSKREAHIERIKQDPETITGEAAKKIFPGSHSYYAKGDEFALPNDWHGEKRWHELLGDELPTRTVILDDRDPISVVDVPAAKRLLEEKGLTPTQEQATEKETARKLAIEAENAADAAEIGRRQALFSMLHGRLGDQATLEHVLIDSIIPLLLVEFWSRLDEVPDLMKIRGEPVWRELNEQQDLDRYIKQLSVTERYRLLVEFVAASLDESVLSVGWGWSPTKPDDLDNFYTVLRAAGIDPDAPPPPESAENPPPPTSAAHAEIETARAEDPAEAAEEAAAEPAAQAHEPSAEAQNPEATPIQAADKPAARKRGRPRKQAAPTPAAEVVQ